MFNGKTHYKWPFSIAMLNYQRVICLSFQSSSNRKKETPGIIIPLTAGHVKSKPPTNHLDYLLIIYGSFSTRGILPPIAINSPQSQSANVVQGILLWRRQFHTPCSNHNVGWLKTNFASLNPLWQTNSHLGLPILTPKKTNVFRPERVQVWSSCPTSIPRFRFSSARLEAVLPLPLSLPLISPFLLVVKKNGHH